MCCKDTECSNEQHLEALNVFYEGLVGVLTEATKKLANRHRKHSNQPGWNDHVADLHKDARECFVMWCNNAQSRIQLLAKGEVVKIMENNILLPHF